MKKLEKLRILDGTSLKLIAMISMVFDHVGDMFFPGALWMRMIGRLAMPLFSFCIAEGYAHTKNKQRYLLRMGVFALVSEIPFDLAFEGRVGLGHQNIMLSFFLAILALMVFDRIRGEGKEHAAGKTLLGILCVCAVAVLALVLRADYTLFAVLAVFLFYVLRNRHPLLRCGVGVGFLALTRTVGLFYAFYPGHLLLLYLLKTVLGG